MISLRSHAFGPHRAPGAMTFTEDDAKQLLEPFIEDGQYIKQQLVEDIQSYPSEYSAEEIEAVMNTTEADMAVLSFVLYQIRQAQTETTPQAIDLTNMAGGEYEVVSDYIPDHGLNMDGLQIPWKRVWACVASAVGIPSAYSALKAGIKGTMTPKTLIKFMSNTISKYCGFITAFIAVCDFLDCMGWTNLDIKTELMKRIEDSVNAILK